MKSHLFKTRKEWVHWCHQVGLHWKDGYFPLTIQVYKGSNKHRTAEQNALLWVTYRQIAEQMSQRVGRVITPEHIHGCCLSMFSELVPNPLDGVARPRSSSQMSVKQLSEYYERVVAWAVDDLGFEIRERHEVEL